MSANISEKLTQLNTNLGTINTEVNDQADIIAQIKSVLSGGVIDGTASSGSTTYTLYGSHLLRTGGFDVGENASYTSADWIESIYTYFYCEDDNGSVVREEIDEIEIVDGEIWITSKESDLTKQYDNNNECWADGFYYTEDIYTPSLLVIEIPYPIEVSQEFYTRFMGIVDNDSGRSPYDVGCQEHGLEALGALCDWQVTTDSSSIPIITIVNYHPFYYLQCDIVCDGETETFTIYPDDSDSWKSWGTLSYTGAIEVTNVRWIANA